MRRINKYDIIIYSSLALAIILLLLGGKDYLSTIESGSVTADELSSSIKAVESPTETADESTKEEPADLVSLDKKTLTINYLNNILDEVIKNDIITYAMVKSWGNYEILDITYNREVADNYYCYIANIKLSNKDALIPDTINDSLSTKENPVIQVNVYIEYSNQAKNYQVKYIDA